MQNEIIETYLTAAEIKGHEAAKIREVACKVAEFYRANENSTKPKSPDCPPKNLPNAKRELINLKLTDDARKELMPNAWTSSPLFPAAQSATVR
jgi:hypothetical protein